MKYNWVANWKAGIFLAALVITGGVLVLSFQLVNEMRATTRRHLMVTVERYRDFLIADDPQPALETIQKIEFPIILADSSGTPLFWKNLPIAPDNHSELAVRELKKYIRAFDKQGNQPISLDLGSGIVQYFHYADENLIRQLQWLMWLGIGATVVLVLLGYYGFNAVRSAENRAMWIGLARETAHQFGTPISSLMAWLELLQQKYHDEPVFGEMERDIQRLQSVLRRFSAIGREEEPVVADLVQTVRDSIAYMEQRLPKRARNIDLHVENERSVPVKMRPELIGWVLENLIRNAAEAIEKGIGKIDIAIKKEHGRAIVTITDNGKGMTSRERHNAFRAGFSTKQKGWGVGLSLARRIVHDEHRGSLTIVSSTQEVGSTFRMELPLAHEAKPLHSDFS
ncbi:MAG: HAMP domain-containing histidine kinase [bacterium]|nr:HAMP domain-containing histidine kinase [bacterium]